MKNKAMMFATWGLALPFVIIGAIVEIAVIGLHIGVEFVDRIFDGGE